MQNNEMREGWLKLAEGWLDMLPTKDPSKALQFERMADTMGTRQEDSPSSH